MMSVQRILRHLSYPRWRVRRAFPKATLQAIEAALAASETSHGGELRFVVEGCLMLPDLLRGVSSRQRAIDLFSALRVWDTEHNSGVLIYVQLADHKLEIVADRGIHQKVGDAAWREVCAAMEQAFRCGDFKRGAIESIRQVGGLLAMHFPPCNGNPNELPDNVEVL